MSDDAPILENRAITLKGDFAAEDLRVRSAIVTEGLSRLGRTRIEFISRDRALDLTDLVGGKMSLEYEFAPGDVRKFMGSCIEAEFIGIFDGYGHFVAEVRPWLWFLTRHTDCRVFQDLSTTDIIKNILLDYGFWTDVKSKLSGSYEPREFCLQYRESDFDFLSRLMEEEGIYYFFTHEDGIEKMVLTDGIGGHATIPQDTIEYRPAESALLSAEDYVFEWASGQRVTTGKVSLVDYDFEKPTSQVEAARERPTGEHPFTNTEFYDYPGHFRDSGLGADRAAGRIDGEAARFQTRHGVSSLPALGTGMIFTLKEAPRSDDDASFVITSATHYLQNEDEIGPRAWTAMHRGIDIGDDNTDTYRVQFEVIPRDTQYRAPRTTPWPRIPGIQTAVVVGPTGEDIYTDKYGRVRIQFHWDREGEKNEKSSVWVRTMMPWTGKLWGMIAIPRIGNEVVVQFEEGNPDRPVVTGMLYNGENMPPYGLPGNMTQSGVKTNSTKGGGGYNELMFEDKKGSELLRMHAQKDHEFTTLNNATITVGHSKAPDGSMSLSVYKNLTESVETGDHKFTVAKGNQTLAVKVDKTETIEGKSDLTVTQSVTETIKMGNFTQTVKMGNHATTLDMGNLSTTLKMGNVSVKADLGSITMEALQKIELKVGASSVKIDPSGVTIEGPMVTVKGTAMTQIKAPMVQVNGDGMLMLKGGMTMIN